MMKSQKESRKTDPREKINDDSVKHAPESGEPREMAQRAEHEGTAKPFEKSRREPGATSKPRQAGNNQSTY